MEDAAADAMIRSLGDRWSYYIPAADYSAHMEQMENAYVGIGITVATVIENGGFQVLKVTPGGPAQEAGILAGDVVLLVEDEMVEDIGIDEAKNRIRGQEGTYVNLSVLRGGEVIPFTVERRSIQVPVALGRMVTETVGLVSIYNFDSRCAKESKGAIEDLRAQGAEALIFDVRFNPGGYKHELVELLDYLLPEGVLFRTQDYTGREDVDKSGPDFLDMPMAVLVNGDSYSAAEFFAAALGEYEAAVIVGEQTCGKGYFQQTYQLLDGSAVGLSVGKYFTPKGVSLAEVGGLTPDVVVSVDEETAVKIYTEQLDPLEDPQIQAALAALEKNP